MRYAITVFKLINILFLKNANQRRHIPVAKK